MKLEAERTEVHHLDAETPPQIDPDGLDAEADSLGVPSLIISPPDSMFDTRDQTSQETGTTYSSIILSSDLNRLPSPLLDLSTLPIADQGAPSGSSFKNSTRTTTAGSTGEIYVESARTASTPSCYWRRYQDSLRSGGSGRPV